MVTRFDLEQKILGCWGIVDDLRVLSNSSDLRDGDLECIARLYELKFNDLFSCFETLIASNTIKDN